MNSWHSIIILKKNRHLQVMSKMLSFKAPSTFDSFKAPSTFDSFKAPSRLKQKPERVALSNTPPSIPKKNTPKKDQVEPRPEFNLRFNDSNPITSTTPNQLRGKSAASTPFIRKEATESMHNSPSARSVRKSKGISIARC
jgi:hypothetical protein